MTIEHPSVERIPLSEIHSTLTPEEVQEFCDWFRRHGIDPNSVAVNDGWVERRPAERQIRYVEIKLDEFGMPEIDEEAKDWIVAPRTIQLEREPGPLPKVIAARFSPEGGRLNTRRPLSSLPPHGASPGVGHGA